MNPRAQIRLLPDGRRLHLNDGPIDLVLEAFGPTAEITEAYRAAAQRFETVLDKLCSELTFLRRPTQVPARSGLSPTHWYECPSLSREGMHQPASFSREAAQDYSPRRKPWETGGKSQSPKGAKETRSLAPAHGHLPQGAVARRMVAAVTPFAAETFITPMAAVAGAVADEILAAMTANANLPRAYVNNGGDIALHLAPGERFTVGMVERPDRPSLLGTTTIHAHQPIRGIATSGWRGRSFSLGIADAVTVLADTAAMADAAATIIANAVDVPGHSAITRVPACELAPDSDLGPRRVTQAVGDLGSDEVDAALSSGLQVADRLLKANLIRAAALNLQSRTRVVGAYSEAPFITAPSMMGYERQDRDRTPSDREGTASDREGTASAVPLDSIRTGASAPKGALGPCKAVHA